nr:ubiquitin hydrolase [Tanacetum cinerariifolium]
MLQICPRIPNQQFDKLPFEEEILAFLRQLGHNEEIKIITDVNINKLHQPWRSFAAVINKCLSGKVQVMTRLLSVTITLSNKAEDPISVSSNGIRAWPAPTVESTSEDDQNRNSSASENGKSTDSILSKPAVKFVKAAERKPSKKPTVRGNHRNWNNLKSYQLGANFVMKKKACYNCGGIDHLSYDYGLGVKKGRTYPKNNYTHRSMPPRPVTHRPPMRPMRQNMNSTRLNKPAHSYGRRSFQKTTQDLVVVLIQRVQRLERELKARTLIHKVDRGRSRPIMAWVPKKD